MPRADPAEEAFADFLARLRSERFEGLEAFLGRHPGLAEVLRPRLELVLGLREALGGGSGGRPPADRRPASAGGARRARRLGPFVLGRALGRGWMGAVHEAEVRQALPGLPEGERVALKLFHAELLRREHLRERFLREGEIGAALTHPHLVRTRARGEVALEGERVPYLAMDLLEGEDLARRLAREGAQPVALVRALALAVARALEALEGAGVVHRDLKPANVFLEADGGVRVLDYGLAGLLDPRGALTQSGAFVGSVRYAAPEQLERRRGAVDGRADQYALGLLLYEAWAGSLPGPAEPLPLLLERRRQAPPPPPSRARPGLPADLDALVLRLLAPDPQGRFARARALVEALETGAGPS